MRLGLAASVIGILAAAAAAGGSAAAVSAGSKTVLVSLAATASGPIQGLSAGDVKVQEDKTPVEVTEVVPATDPMSVVLVLDVTYPMGRNPPTQDLRRAVTSFVSTVRSGAPDAQFAILSVSNAAVPLVDFTSDQARIADAIGHIVVGAQTGSVMLEGVVRASQSLEHRPAPRRAIVAVSFGSAEAGAERPSNVAKELQKSGATLWTMSLASSSDVAQAAARDEAWSKLTAASGGLGLAGVEVTGLDNQLKTIANTLVSQYSVTFARKGDGAVKPLTGETAKGAKILFSRWMR